MILLISECFKQGESLHLIMTAGDMHAQISISILRLFNSWNGLDESFLFQYFHEFYNTLLWVKLNYVPIIPRWNPNGKVLRCNTTKIVVVCCCLTAVLCYCMRAVVCYCPRAVMSYGLSAVVCYCLILIFFTVWAKLCATVWQQLCATVWEQLCSTVWH